VAHAPAWAGLIFSPRGKEEDILKEKGEEEIEEGLPK